MKFTKYYLLVLLVMTSTSKASTLVISLLDSPALLLEGESTSLIVDVNGTFDNITSMLFTFNFEGDLFDPGEQYTVGPFQLTPYRTSKFAQTNITSSSLDIVRTATTSAHRINDPFLDGFEIFDFTSNIGSMNLSSAFLSIDGSFTQNHVYEPVPIPGAVWLFGTGLLSLGVFSRRRHASNKPDTHK